MGDTLKTLGVIGTWLLGSAVAGILACQVFVAVVVILWLSDRPEHDPGSILEYYADQQIESGFAAPALRIDDPLLRSRKVLLTTEINERTAQDVASRLLYLDALDPTRPIDLYISTSGGWIDEAFTIIDAMHLIEAPVNIHAMGGCYSAGALILTAGTGTRTATSSAILMIHTNLTDSEEPYSFGRLGRARYEKVWKQTARLPDEWYPMTSNAAYYLTADEALGFGIIDRVADVELERSEDSDD